MAEMKKKQRWKSWAALLPMGLAFAPLSARPVIGTLLLSMSIFLAAAMVPFFRRCENLAVFLMVALCGFPINLRLAAKAILYLEPETFGGVVVYGLFVLLALFSLQEVIFGMIVRLLWNNQKEIDFE